MYTVYCHKCQKNGKRYVGLTKLDPETRWNHGNGYRENKKFYADIKKYGWDNFSHEILATGLTKKEAQEQERLLIEQYDSIDTGYNNEPGGRVNEPTYLSSTLTAVRRSIKRTKHAKERGYKDFLDSLESVEKDEGSAAVWNEMGENALANTLRLWSKPHFDDEAFFSDFVLNFQEEVRVIEWIMDGCVGERPVYRNPYQKRHDATENAKEVKS